MPVLFEHAEEFEHLDEFEHLEENKKLNWSLDLPAGLRLLNDDVWHGEKALVDGKPLYWSPGARNNLEKSKRESKKELQKNSKNNPKKNSKNNPKKNLKNNPKKKPKNNPKKKPKKNHGEGLERNVQNGCGNINDRNWEKAATEKVLAYVCEQWGTLSAKLK